MENIKLRKSFNNAMERFVEKIKNSRRCLAAFLIGSVSHDLIWEWSDLQILVIFDDSFKGMHHSQSQTRYHIIEEGVPILVDVRRKSEFISYLGSANVADYYFCAISKSTALFINDPTIKDYLEDIFYIGDRDRQGEMLLGFSNAVYYMNKAEKNFRVKKNSENAVFFLLQVAQGIAWLEVAKCRLFPEREIIAQAKKLDPKLFSRIYDRMIYESVTDQMIEEIISINLDYLVSNTKEVYLPILSYLEKWGNLDGFSMPIRPDGFGINFDWLRRMGIAKLEPVPIKIDSQNEEFYRYRYALDERYKGEVYG